VLVVEDDADLREMMCLLLKQDGLDAQPANDGRDALDMLRSGDVQPDVIVLDLMMPRMDGESFLRERALTPALHAIPVVVLTAKPVEQVAVSGVALLRKPINFDLLLDTIWAECEPPRR
jgi:CheY-like chemotaxis protein